MLMELRQCLLQRLAVVRVVQPLVLLYLTAVSK